MNLFGFNKIYFILQIHFFSERKVKQIGTKKNLKNKLQTLKKILKEKNKKQQKVKKEKRTNTRKKEKN